MIASQYPMLNVAMLFPIASRSALFCAHALKQLTTTNTLNLPLVNHTLMPYIDKLINNAWPLYDLNSQLEVYAFISSVLEVLFRRTGLLATVLLFQYLKLRYMLSACSRRGW